MTNLFQIHGLHGRLHARHDAGHRLGDFFGANGALHPLSYGVHSGRHAPKIERLIFVSYGILGIDFGSFHVTLFDRLAKFEEEMKNNFNFDSIMFLSFHTRLSLAFSVTASFSHFLADLSSSLAANFKLNKFLSIALPSFPILCF